MRLSQWIEKQGGTVKVGALLGVQRNRVFAWKAGRALPKFDLMQKIIRVSKGKLTYDSVIDGFKLDRKRARAADKAKSKAARRPKASA